MFKKIMFITVLSVNSLAFSQTTTPYYADLSDPEDLSPALIGGTVAEPGEFPASPWVSNCSSTLIGPKVLITAAHCVSNGGTKSFVIGSNRYTSTCTHNPSYRSNSTADWSLCLVSQPVTGIKFESVATAEEAQCEVGKKYLWSGFGCTRWGGSIDGKFRIGYVATTKCPSGTNYDTITRGSVALCSGDSGGGGYVVFENGDRKLVGTNSRSNTRDTSYVSSTYTAKFRDWASAWASSKSVEICGISADAKDCRSSSNPDPDPDPDPKDCSQEVDKVDSSLAAHVTAVAELKSCLAK